MDWNASTANYLGNGSGGLDVTLTSAVNRSIGIDLGANYFADNAGVHEISLSIQRTGVSAQSWVGLGFTAVHDVGVNQTQTGSAGMPWMLNRMSGSTVVFRGAGATNSFSKTVTTMQSQANTFTLRLDTTGPAWTLAAFANGTPMDLNGMVGGETVYTYSVNPDGLRHIVISNGYNTTDSSAVIDDFTYAFTAVPEPSALLLGGLIPVLAMVRRRR